MDPDAGAAAAAGALRPGGLLALFWNVFRPPPEIGAAFSSAYQRIVPDLPSNPWAKPALDGYWALVAAAADGMDRTGAFGEPQRWQVDWEHRYARDEWLDQVPTHGGHNKLPPDTLAALLSGIGAAIDAMGGGFTMHYTTVAVTAPKAAA